MKKRKPRKPKLEGFFVEKDCSGRAVVTNLYHYRPIGIKWSGPKRLEKIGKFFLAAAKWAKAQEKNK